MAEQGIAILLGPVGEVLDEVLDPFTGGLPKCFHPAEVSRVRLDEVRIELVLANELAEAIPNCASAVSVVRLGRQFLRFLGKTLSDLRSNS